MTDEELEAIQKRFEEWASFAGAYRYRSDDAFSDQDAFFMNQARFDLPALLAEVRRLREPSITSHTTMLERQLEAEVRRLRTENEKLEDEVERWQTEYSER